MTDNLVHDHSFRRGVLGRGGQMLFLLVNDALARERTPHTHVMLFESGRFRPVATVTWTACAAVFLGWDDAELAVIGERGELLKVRRDASCSEERLLEEPPARPFVFRGAACRDGSLLVVGAGFACALVRCDGARLDVSPYRLGTPVDGLGTGFEAVAMASANDALAVGWDGVLFHFDGSAWTREASPSSCILAHATVRADGEYWACGQGGTIVRGRPGAWRRLETGVTHNLWSIAAYAGGLVTAELRALFRLELDRDALQLIDLDCEPSSYGWLDSVHDDTLLCTGAKDVVLITDDHEHIIAGA